MEESLFSDIQQAFPDAEILPVEGSTCDSYRVKLYGKLHFLKRLKPELRTDPRYIAALKKEFETGYNLEHPHLVRYVSVGDDYLMTEYIDGQSLNHFVKSHPDYFGVKKNICRFLSQLLDVVSYLHQHQIVHLDLKPSNILITRIDHSVKLVDLGYCYTDTYTDTMGRTDKYAAPEQLNGMENVDARTDIYAIGKILQTLPCAYKYNKVIARCTAPEKESRYQSVEEVLYDISHQNRYYRYVALFAAIVALLAVSFALLTHQQDVAPIIPEHPNDSVAPIQRNTTSFPKDNHESAPMIPQSKNATLTPLIPPTANNTVSDIEKLRKDIQNCILPKFNATIGALSDSVMPGSDGWAKVCREFEPMIAQSLKDLLTSHQSVPMETVTKEFNDYVQSLITLKMNQATRIASDEHNNEVK